MLRKIIIIVILTGFLLIFFQSQQKSPCQAAEISLATIIIEPMSGPAGKTKLTIYGSGFTPGEKVRIILGLEGTDIALATKGSGGIVKANQHGAFVLKPRGGIPGKKVISPGVYTVKAVGDRGSMASTPLHVVK